jgi:hypothetical protein
MTGLPDDTASRLQALAAAVARLRPDWRDAERFYEARSEIIAALRALARSPQLTRVVVRFVAAPPLPVQATHRPPPELPAARVPPPLPAAQRAPTRPHRPARRHRIPRPPRLPANIQPGLWEARS